MESKKINQLATEMAPASTDLTIIGDPITGVSKKVTLEQISSLFASSISFYTNYASFPATGNVDTLYCAKDTNKLYLWSGSAYVETFPSQALLDTYQLRSEKGNANGYASLDSLGKVPISQLPSSLMEYKGTWNASTNTPTLANGTGDTGDVYICNVAGTVNFGAGNITFAVGDYVIYSGTIWQRSSGAVGTVTSVAITESGDALSITGSPITTSGTINIGFAGTSAQYVAGDGSLVTFPSLTVYVPYTGATANVDLGEYELKAGQLTLDVSPTGTAAVGTTRWNNTIGSSETTLKGGNVILKNGVDLVARVVNKVSPNTTLTKAAYPAVRVSGAQGQRLAVAYAQANNDNNSADTIGLVTETIATNQEGFIMTVGQLEGIDTTGSLQGETWADGDVLYLSPTTAGALTNIKPTGATGHIVVMGYVEYAHANNGKIYVKVMNGWELDELHNVYISSVANNEGLFYESSTSLWKNKSIATVLGYTPISLTSLSATSPLSYNNTTGAFSISQASGSANGYLSSTDWTTFNNKQNALTNPVTGTGTSGQVSYFNGTSSITGNNNFFWDTTNSRLGIGLNNPQRSLEIYSATADSHLRLSGAAPTISMGEAITGAIYQAKFGLVTANGQFYTGAVAGDFVIISQTGSTIWGNSGGERMRLNTNGTFSIGNTNNTYNLDVTGTGRFTGDLTLSGSSGNRTLNIQTNTSGDAILSLTAAGSDSGSITYKRSTSELIFANSGATSALKIASTGAATFSSNVIAPQFYANIVGGGFRGIEYQSSGTIFGYSKADSSSGEYRHNIGPSSGWGGFMTFLTDTTERMRITSGGNVGIGTTSPAYKLDVTGQARFTSSGISNVSFGVVANAASGIAEGPYINLVNNSNSYQILQQLNGSYNLDFWSYRGGWSNVSRIDGSSGTYTALSDKNKKKDFEDSTIGLQAILGLNPTLYRMKSDSNETPKQLGFIAQEVEQFIPQAYVEQDGFIGLNDRPIIAALVKAIQEQQAQIEELKAKIK